MRVLRKTEGISRYREIGTVAMTKRPIQDSREEP
jgi:hypothetical protein